MTTSRAVALSFALLVIVRPLPAQTAVPTARRVMTVDDLVKEEVFGPLAPQPSGERIAIVSQPNWCCYEPVFGSRLWSVSRETGERFAIGDKEFPRHWHENLVWSPNGSRLAIAARALADGNTRLYVWDPKTGTVRQISAGPIAYRILLGSSSSAEVVWLNDRTVVYTEIPDSAVATVDKSPEDFFRFIAPQVWDKMAEGIEPSASVIESGRVDSAAVRSLATNLVSVDVITGERRVLATPHIPARYRQVSIHLSPDLRWAILRVADKQPPRADVPLTMERLWREFVGVFALGSASTIRWFAHDLNPGASVVWTPDASTAVVTATPFGGSETIQWVVDPATARAELKRAPFPRDSVEKSGRSQQRPRPEIIRLPAGARMVTDYSNQALTLYTMLTDSGSFAYATKWETGQTSQLMVLNRYIADIERGRRILIEYRGNEGETLKGIVLLPPNYHSGRRYPVLTWVYAGQVYRTPDVNSYVLSDRPMSSTNMQVLAAREYVVLFPSIPMPADSGSRDQLLAIPGPVLSALDKLVELGIADPGRLAVAGHSNGGYTTNVLITQTDRFKAAITMAGTTNLTSLYGTFDARFRYTDMAVRDGTLQMHWAEAGQARLAAPLWANLWAYLRNSPVFYADRVKTPVLFLHGDQDFVPISEAEQLFTSLYRQGKRARFVRYWGEGHQIGASPANTRHRWNEIFAWLDEHCDISRDAKGHMIFQGDRVKSREGKPALRPGDFTRFH